MARKSLSSQVMEELDRARGILTSLQDSSDPIPAILIGTALESLHRIETLCVNAIREKATAVMENRDVDHEMVEVAPSGEPVRRRSGSHRAPRKQVAN